MHLASLYRMVGRFDDALREVLKAYELRPDAPVVLTVLGVVYMDKGMYQEAVAAHERLVELTPSGRWTLAITYARTGRPERARAIAAELESEPTAWNALGLGHLYGTLGDYDRAFEWLNHEPNHAWLPWIRGPARRPWLAAVQEDPRYRALLDRMRLPPPMAGTVKETN